MITQVKAAVRCVSDQEQSLDFYVNKLGFIRVTDAEMWPGARWLEVRPPSGQTTIVLSSAEQFGKTPEEGAFRTFACDDIRKPCVRCAQPDSP